MTGRKTHEQQIRTFERKPDLTEAGGQQQAADGSRRAAPGVRDSEFPVSMAGMNSESDHNKHDHHDPRHKHQRHGPDEEKH